MGYRARVKRVFRWTTHEAAEAAEVRYWRSRPVVERVSAVETIREATLGIYGEAPARLVRVYRFVTRPTRSLPGVGAHALAAHGRPRATQDLDVLVQPTEANARRVALARRGFGFPGIARA